MAALQVHVDADDIARGEPGVTESCPIALALLRAGVVDPFVTEDEICGTDTGSGVRFSISTTGLRANGWPLWMFVDCFDLGGAGYGCDAADIVRPFSLTLEVL